MYTTRSLSHTSQLLHKSNPIRTLSASFSPMSPSKVPRLSDGSTLLIPGPITMSAGVVSALGEQSVSHTSAAFARVFRDALGKLRRVFRADAARGAPVVLSGSGTLGFDVLGGNLVRRDTDKVLLLSTGFFSDELHDALAQCYAARPGAQVTRLAAKRAGDTVPLAAVEEALSRDSYALVAMTQVDTSTGVLLDVRGVAELVRRVSPGTLIAVDTVCALGCEELRFDEWGIDFAFSASQKAVGAPPGLCLGMLSERAVARAAELAASGEAQGGYYASLARWLPVLRAFEAGGAAYFATPPVQLVAALDTALGEILDYSYGEHPRGIEARVAKHRDTSDTVKRHCVDTLGLKLVSGTLDNSAHGLTAVYVSQPADTIKRMHEAGYTIAGGIHKDIRGEYVRIGHMGVSACDDELGHVGGCLAALDRAV